MFDNVAILYILDLILIIQWSDKVKISHNKFNNWLDTFVSEKDIDLEYSFEVKGNENGMEHFIPVGNVIEHMKINFNEEDKYIAYDRIVKLDFKNANIYHFLGFVAQFMAIQWENSNV